MHTYLNTVIRKLGALLTDFVHGIDAASAIRHGIEPTTAHPARVTAGSRRPRAGM